MSEDRIGRRNAKLSEKLHDAVFPVLILHNLHHRFRFCDVGADAQRMIIGKPPELSEQLGRGVDRWSIGAGHKPQTVSILVLTQKVLDLSKCLLGLFLRAIRYDLAPIHDRAHEHSSHARIGSAAHVVDGSNKWCWQRRLTPRARPVRDPAKLLT